MLLTTGQLVGETLAQVLQVDQLQQFGDHAVFLRVLANAEGDVVGHAEVGKQRVVLEHHADTTFLRRQGEPCTGDDFAGQADFAFVDRFKPCDRAQGSGLAAPRGTEQATDVARVEVQVEVLHHPLILIAACQIAQVQQ